MAARYWVNGGTGNWNSTTNWASTSGGASGASVPGTSDDVTFDGAGDSASLMNSAGGYTINSLTVTSGYTSTLTLTTVTVNINGNVSLGSAMTLTGTGTIRVGYVDNTSVTFDSNGCTIGCNLWIGHGSGSIGVTVTLLENVLLTGNATLSQGSSTGDVILNGFQLECQGDVSFAGSSSGRVFRGTTLLLISGANNQQLSSTGLFRLNTTINKSGGTLTITSIIYDTGTFAVDGGNTGTITHTGTLTITTSSTTTTFNTGVSISWNNVTWSASLTTIVLSSTWIITGNLTLSSSQTHTISGAGYLTAVGGTLSLVSNGCIFNPANDMTVGNLSSTTGTGTFCSITGYNINVTGNLTTSGSSVDGLGTIIMTGTGIWSGGASTTVNINLIFNTSGTITVSGSVAFGVSSSTRTLLYTAGTIVTTGSTITFRTCILNSNVVVWNNVVITTTPTITLTGDLNVVGLLTMNNSATTLNSSTGKKVYAASITVGNNNILGTSSIEVNATGTLTGSQTNFYFGLPVVLNASSGTISLSGSLHFQGSTLTYTSGTISPDASTVIFSGTMAINANGLNFNVLDLDGNTTFTSTGSFGWSTSTLQSVTGTHIYKSGATYTINTLLQLVGTAAARIIMLSSIGGSQAYFNLAPAATQTNGYVTTTDINSAAGQTIFDWFGELSNTVNWDLLVAPATTSYTFFL